MVGEIERLGDPDARGLAREVVRAVLELHGAGLARLLGTLGSAGEPAARAILDGCARDPLVSSLLLLHGLHPVALETRVRGAVESLGAGVELLAIEDGVVRVRVTPPRSRAAVEAALVEAAPDAGAIEVEEVAPLISVERLRASVPR
jgi:hypothetical protein